MYSYSLPCWDGIQALQRMTERSIDILHYASICLTEEQADGGKLPRKLT